MTDFLLFFALVKIIHRGFAGLGWIMHRGLLLIPAQFLRNQVLFFDDKGLCMGALQLMHRGFAAYAPGLCSLCIGAYAPGPRAS